MKIWIEKTNVKGRQDRLRGERAFSQVLWSPKAEVMQAHYAE